MSYRNGCVLVPSSAGPGCVPAAAVPECRPALGAVPVISLPCRVLQPLKTTGCCTPPECVRAQSASATVAEQCAGTALRSLPRRLRQTSWSSTWQWQRQTGRTFKKLHQLVQAGSCCGCCCSAQVCNTHLITCCHLLSNNCVTHLVTH
jgi:hypothetical protein